MHAADIFLLPSITGADKTAEGQGLALQEAQAVGLPVIATLHNGFPENISDGLTGLLVPEKDPLALANAVLRLAKDAALRQSIGTNARSYVETSFDSKNLAVIQEEIFREAIDHHLHDFAK
jgi:colanic acid/amylovoran biosynthesis glycosyltransferase